MQVVQERTRKGKSLVNLDTSLDSLTSFSLFLISKVTSRIWRVHLCLCFSTTQCLCVCFLSLFLLSEGSCIFHGYTPLLAGNYIWKMNKQKGFDYPKQSSKTFFFIIYRPHACRDVWRGGEPDSLTRRPSHLIKRLIVCLFWIQTIFNITPFFSHP